MAQINLFLQTKGGVGTSLVSSIYKQYCQDHAAKTICLYIGPFNEIIINDKELEVKNVHVLDDGKLNSHEFDLFIEELSKEPNETAVVIDIAASAFLLVCSYLKENDLISVLSDQGHNIKIHTIVTGGQAVLDTLNGAEALLRNFPNVPVIIWLNYYFGKPEVNDVPVEDSKLFKKHSEIIHAVIKLDELTKATFAYDFNQMLDARMTFKEAIASTDFMIMQRQRLTMIQRSIKQQIDQACL